MEAVPAVEQRHIHRIGACQSPPIAQRRRTFAVQIGRWQQAREEQNQPSLQSWTDKIREGLVLINQVAQKGMHLGVVVLAAMGFKTQRAML